MLEALEGWWVELGIADHFPGRVNERHPMAERASRRVGEGIDVEPGTPLRCDETRLAKDFCGALLVEARSQPTVYDRDEKRHKQGHDQQRADEEPLCERHVSVIVRWPRARSPTQGRSSQALRDCPAARRR